MNDFDSNGNVLLAVFVNIVCALMLLGVYKLFFNDRLKIVYRILLAWSLLPIAFVISESGILDVGKYVSYTIMIIILVFYTGYILYNKIKQQEEKLKYHRVYLREINRENDFEEFQTFAKRVGVDNIRWNTY